MDTRKIITLNEQSGAIDFISIYSHVNGSEKHFKFPVKDNQVEVPHFYERMFGRELLDSIVEIANQALENEDFDEII